jgi:phosphoribosyl 1,2-cyclic phosphate phosphodiesterase
MTLAVTILGCGSSGGVPRLGSGWGACDPHNPRNRRRRCSILVERTGAAGVTQVLVDTSPDLRDQLLGAGVTRLDAVLFTHDHADHTHGIDDLRPLVIHMRRRIPIYADRATDLVLGHRFGYCFASPPGSVYPPILDRRELRADATVAIDGPGGLVEAGPFRVAHGETEALGFRFGGLAYLPDVSSVPEESLGHPLLALGRLGLDRAGPSATSHSHEPAHGPRFRPTRAILAERHRTRVRRHADLSTPRTSRPSST